MVTLRWGHGTRVGSRGHREGHPAWAPPALAEGHPARGAAPRPLTAPPCPSRFRGCRGGSPAVTSWRRRGVTRCGGSDVRRGPPAAWRPCPRRPARADMVRAGTRRGRGDTAAAEGGARPPRGRDGPAAARGGGGAAALGVPPCPGVPRLGAGMGPEQEEGPPRRHRPGIPRQLHAQCLSCSSILLLHPAVPILVLHPAVPILLPNPAVPSCSPTLVLHRSVPILLLHPILILFPHSSVLVLLVHPAVSILLLSNLLPPSSLSQPAPPSHCPLNYCSHPAPPIPLPTSHIPILLPPNTPPNPYHSPYPTAPPNCFPKSTPPNPLPRTSSPLCSP